MPTIETSRIRAKQDKIQAHRISENEYRVYNIVRGTSYSVLRGENGIWRCECPFMTKGSHTGSSGVCKHLTRVFDKLRGCGQGICREGALCASCRFVEKMFRVG